MARKAKHGGGRPRIFRENDTEAAYLTLKLDGATLRFMHRMTGHAGGQLAAGARMVIAAGVAALKKSGAGR